MLKVVQKMSSTGFKLLIDFVSFLQKSVGSDKNPNTMRPDVTNPYWLVAIENMHHRNNG